MMIRASEPPMKWRRSFGLNRMTWRIRAICLSRCHRYLLRKNKRRSLPHCLKPRVCEAEIPALGDHYWRPVESVTLQSQRNASAFCSKNVALFGAGEGMNPDGINRQNEANRADKQKPRRETSGDEA
ncbi:MULTISPECIES: hypothetical protein [unclassified Bradyrhizobium]|uniref:hypothetical protein n=1 Tax=unclassified Bradyrhizobium TaxID=2631580 RepID=UPI0033992023